MKDTKKDHSNGATSERSAETKSSSQTNHAPNSDNTTSGCERPQGIVSAMLSHGRENAITGQALVDLLGLRSGRELTKLIEVERRTGSPICASLNSRNPGYFLAETSEELKRYIASLDRRIREVSMTRSCCIKTLERWRDDNR